MPCPCLGSDCCIGCPESWPGSCPKLCPAKARKSITGAVQCSRLLRFSQKLVSRLFCGLNPALKRAEHLLNWSISIFWPGAYPFSVDPNPILCFTHPTCKWSMGCLEWVLGPGQIQCLPPLLTKTGHVTPSCRDALTGKSKVVRRGASSSHLPSSSRVFPSLPTPLALPRPPENICRESLLAHIGRTTGEVMPQNTESGICQFFPEGK